MYICDNTKNVYKAHIPIEDKREKKQNWLQIFIWLIIL